MHNKVLHDHHTLYGPHLKYEVSSNIFAFSFSAFKLGTLTDVSDKNMFTFLKMVDGTSQLPARNFPTSQLFNFPYTLSPLKVCNWPKSWD